MMTMAKEVMVVGCCESGWMLAKDQELGKGWHLAKV